MAAVIYVDFRPRRTEFLLAGLVVASSACAMTLAAAYMAAAVYPWIRAFDK